MHEVVVLDVVGQHSHPIVRSIEELGVYVRTGSPPLAFPCKYNNSTRDVEELIFRRVIKEMEGETNPHNLAEFLDADADRHQEAVEKIRDKLNLSSLQYQSVEGMEQAIGVPKQELCEYCWTGED